MAKGKPVLSEPTYFILAALLNGPLHGHGIIKRVVYLCSPRSARACLPLGVGG